MGHLIDPDDCVLAVIDVQPGFLARVEDGDDIVERIAFLVLSARVLRDPGDRHGRVARDLGAASIPGSPGTRPSARRCSAWRTIRWPAPPCRDTGRGTVVLTGLETDVCVAHSALGLLDSGRRVVVVEDAVGSPGAAHGAGLERMRRAGVVSVVTKQLHYEWMRTVARSRAFADANPGWPSRRACCCSTGLRAGGTIA